MLIKTSCIIQGVKDLNYKNKALTLSFNCTKCGAISFNKLLNLKGKNKIFFFKPIKV